MIRIAITEPDIGAIYCRADKNASATAQLAAQLYLVALTPENTNALRQTVKLIRTADTDKNALFSDEGATPFMHFSARYCPISVTNEFYKCPDTFLNYSGGQGNILSVMARNIRAHSEQPHQEHRHDLLTKFGLLHQFITDTRITIHDQAQHEHSLSAIAATIQGSEGTIIKGMVKQRNHIIGCLYSAHLSAFSHAACNATIEQTLSHTHELQETNFSGSFRQATSAHLENLTLRNTPRIEHMRYSQLNINPRAFQAAHNLNPTDSAEVTLTLRAVAAEILHRAADTCATSSAIRAIAPSVKLMASYFTQTIPLPLAP